MTTSNTELAAQARKVLEGLGTTSGCTSTDQESINAAYRILRQLADALESKAEPVATVESAAPGAGGFHCKLAAGAPMPLVGMQLYTAPVQPEKDERKPLTDAHIEKLRQATFSTNNPFCPVDSKSMRKAVWAAERAHGIGSSTEGGGDE